MDSIDDLHWESNFSIRPPRVFKILSTQFSATIPSEFLVNYLYVAGPNLGHYEGDFIITRLLDNYY